MTLSELLRAHRDRTRDTWAEMASRATESGYPITRQYLSQLAKGGLREVPGADIIRALAVATREDPSAIYRAAGEELGFRIEGAFELGDQTVKAFLALTADRTDEEKAVLLAALEAEARRMDLYRPVGGDVTERNGSMVQPSE